MSVDRNEKQQSKDEYTLLLPLFYRLIDMAENSAEYWETFEDIITNRASFLIERVLPGMSLDFDTALGLIRRKNDFTTEHERQQRDVLVAAIDNLVDFAAAQEWQMVEEIAEVEDIEDTEDFDIEEGIFEKYNLTYASQENQEVSYAAEVAGWWISVANETLITYMTQGDERVRDWHLSMEGLSFRKSEFPAELIPPIEWGCRCFLIADGFTSVVGSIGGRKDLSKGINPIFNESLAKGGRIFSSAHPYFQKTLPQEVLNIAIRIKAKFYNEDNT